EAPAPGEGASQARPGAGDGGAAGAGTAGQSGTGSGDPIDPESLWRWIWELAGVCGLNPLPLTLRELLWAATGAWDTWADVLALDAETNRDPKKRKQPFTREECNPLRRAQRSKRTSDLPAVDGFALLKELYVDGPNRRKRR